MGRFTRRTARTVGAAPGITPRQAARLPESLETTNLIGHMAVGQSGWTVPWAMFVDTDRAYWLRSGYTYDGRPGGTVSMRVTRVADGYEVDLRQLTCHETWRPGEAPDTRSCPVVKITR